jgi:hypothetical protein
MTEAIRTFHTEIQDTLNTDAKVSVAIKAGLLPEDLQTEKQISEADITAFCQGCDNFQSEGVPCNAVGSNDQARYTARKWCGWATVGGVRTIMEG